MTPETLAALNALNASVKAEADAIAVVKEANAKVQVDAGVLASTLADPPAPNPPAPNPPAPNPPAPNPPAPNPPAPNPPAPQSFATRITLDPTRLIGFAWDFTIGDEAYDRKESEAVSNGAPLPVRIIAGRMTNPIGRRPFESDVYEVKIDGVSFMTINPPDGANQFDFLIDVSLLSEGHHMMSVEGLSGESCIPTFFQIDRGGQVPSLVPLFATSYDMMSRGWTSFAYDWVLPRDQPIKRPLPAREFVPFETLPVRATIVERHLIPADLGAIYGPRVGSNPRRVHTRADQWYYWDTMSGSKYPALPHIGGKRGEAILGSAMHITMGRVGGADYILTPWALFSVSHAEQEVKPLLGYVHSGIAPDFEHSSTEAQIKASAVKAGEFSEDLLFHDGWGHCFLSRTTAEGTGPKIPNDGQNGKLEPPHDSAVLGLIAGGSTGNLVQTESDGRSHATPMKGRVIGKFNDPWDVIEIPGTPYAVVSVRQDHRLAVVDATTGAEVETLIGNSKGDDFAYIGQNRVFRLRQSLAKVREQSIVLPEGLFWYDGWIYWASAAMAQIRRINWITREQQIVIPNGFVSGGVNFYKMAMEVDGKFMPKGTIFLSTWSITHRGRPIAYLPDGTVHAFASANASEYGPGLPTTTIGYSSACGVKNGRLVHSSSSQGLWEISRALPSDPVINQARYERGLKLYKELWADMTHGEGGWGRFGRPMAWGIDPDIDYYLEAHGHMKG